MKVIGYHAYRYNFSGKRIPRQNSKISYAQQISKPSYETTLQLDDDTPIQDVNTTLEKVENMLIIAAKKCLKINTGKKRRRIKPKPMSNKKWFDKECLFTKNELRKLSNQKHRDPKFTREISRCFNGIQKVVVQKMN